MSCKHLIFEKGCSNCEITNKKMEKDNEKLTRAERVGSRKQDFNFTKIGNWQKVHKLDYK
jgi:hypothetical protein